MAAENTEIDQNRWCNDYNNANEEQVVTEEYSVEEQLTRDQHTRKR
jgi:hypothetical protein